MACDDQTVHYTVPSAWMSTCTVEGHKSVRMLCGVRMTRLSFIYRYNHYL